MMRGRVREPGLFDPGPYGAALNDALNLHHFLFNFIDLRHFQQCCMALNERKLLTLEQIDNDTRTRVGNSARGVIAQGSISKNASEELP